MLWLVEGAARDDTNSHVRWPWSSSQIDRRSASKSKFAARV